MAYAHVQSRSQAFNNPAVGTGGTLAYTSSVTAGNMLLVAVASFNFQVNTITDTLGHTYTLAGTATHPTNQERVTLYYKDNCSGGANSVTVKLTSQEDLTLAIHEYSGLLSSGSFDQWDPNDGSGTAITVGPTPTTTQNEELVFVCLGNDNTTGPTNFTDTLTQRQNINSSADMGVTTGDKRITSTGAQSEAWTQGAVAAGWAVIIATFKEATAVADDFPAGRLPAFRAVVRRIV